MKHSIDINHYEDIVRILKSSQKQIKHQTRSLMNYKEIYIKLKEHDKSLTEERFSTDYLGMSKHYVSMCKSRKVEISDKAVLRLLGNLKKLSKQWQQIEDTNEARLAIRAKTRAEHYEDLAEMTLSAALYRV